MSQQTKSQQEIPQHDPVQQAIGALSDPDGLSRLATQRFRDDLRGRIQDQAHLLFRDAKHLSEGKLKNRARDVFRLVAHSLNELIQNLVNAAGLDLQMLTADAEYPLTKPWCQDAEDVAVKLSKQEIAVVGDTLPKFLAQGGATAEGDDDSKSGWIEDLTSEEKDRIVQVVREEFTQQRAGYEVRVKEILAGHGLGAEDASPADGDIQEQSDRTNKNAHPIKTGKNVLKRPASQHKIELKYWAVGQDGKDWWLFRKASQKWDQYRKVDIPAGNPHAILFAIADSGGTISSDDAVKIWRPRYAGADAAWMKRSITHALTKAKLAIKDAISRAGKCDKSKIGNPIPNKRAPRGGGSSCWQAEIGVGFAVTDEACPKALAFRTKDEVGVVF